MRSGLRCLARFSFRQILVCMFVICMVELVERDKSYFESLGYQMLSTVQINDHVSTPIGVSNFPHPDPYTHTLSIYSISDHDEETNENYLRKSILHLSDHSHFPDFDTDLHKYDKNTIHDDKVFYSYLEMKYFSRIKLNNKMHSISLRVIHSDCLTPLFFLSKESDLSIELNKIDSYLKIELKNEPYNHLHSILKSYSQIFDDYQERIINQYISPDEIYLYLLCPFWKSAESQKLTVEISQDISTNLEIDLCKFSTYLILKIVKSLMKKIL